MIEQYGSRNEGVEKRPLMCMSQWLEAPVVLNVVSVHVFSCCWGEQLVFCLYKAVCHLQEEKIWF